MPSVEKCSTLYSECKAFGDDNSFISKQDASCKDNRKSPSTFDLKMVILAALAASQFIYNLYLTGQIQRLNSDMSIVKEMVDRMNHRINAKSPSLATTSQEISSKHFTRPSQAYDPEFGNRYVVIESGINDHPTIEIEVSDDEDLLHKRVRRDADSSGDMHSRKRAVVTSQSHRSKRGSKDSKKWKKSYSKKRKAIHFQTTEVKEECPPGYNSEDRKRGRLCFAVIPKSMLSGFTQNDAGEFSAQVSGIYYIYSQVVFGGTDGTGDYIISQIWKNFGNSWDNEKLSKCQTSAVSENGHVTCSTSTLVQLSPGDTISLVITPKEAMGSVKREKIGTHIGGFLVGFR